MVVVAELPTYSELWSRHRESINIVMGGVLGGFLGLSISRNGVLGGSYFDLFALIILNSWAVIQILEMYDRYTEGLRWLAAIYFVVLIPSVALASWSASRLGIDGGIVATIFIAWIFMIVSIFLASEFAKWLKRKKNV